MIPPNVAGVDDNKTEVSQAEILSDGGFCGTERFWKISQAIMHDAATSIAMFWQDVWTDFLGAVRADGPN